MLIRASCMFETASIARRATRRIILCGRLHVRLSEEVPKPGTELPKSKFQAVGLSRWISKKD